MMALRFSHDSDKSASQISHLKQYIQYVYVYDVFLVWKMALSYLNYTVS